jgi:hypothetical protein
MATGKLPKRGVAPFADAVRDAIGAKDDDEVIVTTPQFTRPAGEPGPAAPPSSPDDWEALSSASRQELKERGCRCWSALREVDEESAGPGARRRGARYEDVDEGGTHELWLFPGEWYSSIPRGFGIIDIFGTDETFEPGKTDDDIRFGCLSFGVVIPIKRSPS